MTRTLIGSNYMQKHAEAIKRVMDGQSYMDFNVEIGRCGPCSWCVSVSTEREGTTEKELYDMFIYCALTELANIK